MANFKVNQKTKTVTAYRLSITEQDYKTLERYKSMNYEVIMLEKTAPRKKTGVTKNELSKYLENKISSNIYEELKEHIKNKENFLVIKSWLKNSLKEDAEKNNKEYISFEEIIRQAKIEEEEQATLNEDKVNTNKNKEKSKENK